jgi:branched-chain amino acid aminotransferase
VVYLDAKSDTYLEEVSSCNIFVRTGRTIKTPPLSGTILPGACCVGDRERGVACA